MPRTFNFRKDFSQLDTDKVTKAEMYEKLSNDLIQKLIDTVCEGYDVDLEKVNLPNPNNYRSYADFTCYPLDKQVMGIASRFDKARGSDDKVEISGDIYAHDELKPYYTANLKLECWDYTFLYSKTYRLTYGSDKWEETTNS